MPQHLHLDYETFSEADLKEVGAYRYAFDPSTEIICAAMALDNGDPVVWDCLTKYDFPRHFDALENPEVLIYAHNAQFEIAISTALMWKTWGIPCPAIERWRCTMSLARRAALPGGLDKLGEALQISTQKDTRGKALIKKFSMMQKEGRVTKKNPNGVPSRRIYPQDDPVAFGEFLEYCKTDVLLEQEVPRRLSYFDEPINNANYTLHEKINARGVAVNLAALAHAQKLIDEETELVGHRFRELTGFEFTQNKELLKWLHSRGCHIDNLQAETIDNFLEEWEDYDKEKWADEMRNQEQWHSIDALRMKQSVAYVSIKKVQTMLRCAGPHDNRIRGMLNHHGATTGRSTNSLVQFQNMKRSTLGAGWSELAYQAICDGISREMLELCFGPVLEVISSCIRHFVQDI